MRKGDVRTPYRFEDFLRSKHDDSATAEYYERILRRTIVPKLQKETGKLLWDITSLEEIYRLWYSTKREEERAAIGHYLEYLKKENGINDWPLFYACHKKIWELDTPQILSHFREWLKKNEYSNNSIAIDNCIKKVLYIAKNENINLSKLVKNINFIIIYYMPGSHNEELLKEDFDAYRIAILNFYNFILDYGKELIRKMYTVSKPTSNYELVKRNLNIWYNKLNSPYIKIICLYYKYCQDNNNTPPTKHQLEELCLQANLKKNLVRTYLCYLCKPNNKQTGQIFSQRSKKSPLKVLSELKFTMQNFYQKIYETQSYAEKMTVSDISENTQI